MTPEERIERGLKNIDAMMDAREARCVAEDPARKAAGYAPECPVKGFRFHPMTLQEWDAIPDGSLVDMVPISRDIPLWRRRLHRAMLAVVVIWFIVWLWHQFSLMAAIEQAQADPVPIYFEGDFDYDEDVDLRDFARFQANFTGEGIGGPQ